MKPTRFMQTTLLALCSALLAACCNDAATRGKTNAGSALDSADAGAARGRPAAAPAAATHCRIGHEYVRNPNDGSVIEFPLVWFVRTAEADEFASASGMNFEIVKNHFNSAVSVTPPVKIDRRDRFVNTVSGGTVAVAYTNAAGQTGQKDFSAALTMQKFASDNLWAQGDAILQGTTDKAGMIAVFMLADTASCKHSYYAGTSPLPSCKQLLVEYFDKDDLLVAQDLPQTGGLGQNIFPVTHPKCRDGDLMETSDGEGHEGPP